LARYSVDVRESAQKAFFALASDVRSRVGDALRDLSGDPRPKGYKKLRGRFGAGSRKVYRIRVGKYRVLYTVDDATRSVSVLVIDGRDDVYRK
jgi:mRNA interferase RelE/StbE